jgi:hypothetical protein
MYAWFSIRSRITGYLNAAAGWQAIERGYGSTIIGDGEGGSSPFFSKFMERFQFLREEILLSSKKQEEEIKSTETWISQRSIIF